MKKLIRGIVDFRQNVRPTVKEKFADLALGQRPDTLFIACSDSRVVPNLFASSDPGDLFVIRNVGNMIPPCGEEGHSDSDESEAAALEFALQKLPVTDIIVCGHSECGAMIQSIKGRDAVKTAPNLKDWLRHAEDSLLKLESEFPSPSMDTKDPNEGMERHNLLSRLNVLAQIEHLKTYPEVARLYREGKLRLHGWWFDIREANVYAYDEAEKAFKLIDEAYAEVLLKRAQ